LENNWENLPPDHPLIVIIKGVLNAAGIDQPPALTIRVTSTIPVAAGLGSGAAVSVAIIRALSKFLGQSFADAEISQMVFEVEKLHHGTPSGIDNTVITYEKPIYFIKEGIGKPGEMEIFPVSKPFTIVIADSGTSSPTAAAVGDVREDWQKDKNTFESLFESAGRIVNQARAAIETGDNTALGPLMNENQDILEKIGVSSGKLAQLIQSARKAGALGAKLSGAGRGGNMIALATRETAGEIANALSTAGATSTIITTVNG